MEILLNPICKYMRNLKIIVVLFVIAFTASCSKSLTFTQSEIELIGSDSTAGKMRVYTMNRPADTLVLRGVSSYFTLEDLKSDYYKILKKRMLITVLDSANAGVGIAAPQVGIGKRLVAVQRLDKEGEPFEFYANIKFLDLSQERKWGWEGCLSIPNKRDTVLRSNRVIISFLDDKTFTEKNDTIVGFTAVIFQHEIDHLQGILYTDR